MSAVEANPPIREQILSAATRLFAARGFDGASLQEIAAAVGIRKPSLLYHFNSKAELRQAVLEEMLGHWNQAMPALLAAASSGEGQFENVVGELVAFFTVDPDRARLLVREVLDRPQEVQRLLDTHIRPWVELVVGHIRRGQERGHLRPSTDPEAYVVHVINLVLAGVVTHDCLQLVSDERHREELLRVARTSLFCDDAAPTEV